MYDYLLAAIESFIRYGLSPTALVVSIIALLKTKKVKRMIGRRIPWLFRDESDVLNYQARQIRIESKLDTLIEERGIVWAGASETLTSGARSLHQSLPSSPEVKYMGFQQRRQSKMNKFKSRKFILAVVSAVLIVLNDGMDLGIDSDTVLAFAGLVAAWIAGEAFVDGKRAEGVTTDEIHTSDPGDAE